VSRRWLAWFCSAAAGAIWLIGCGVPRLRQPAEAKLAFIADERIFTAYAFVAVVTRPQELMKRAHQSRRSALRRELHRRLRRVTPAAVRRWKRFAKTTYFGHMSSYLTLVLRCGDPPGFDLQPSRLPKSELWLFQQLRGLPPQLKDFYQRMRIDKLWAGYRSTHLDLLPPDQRRQLSERISALERFITVEQRYRRYLIAPAFFYSVDAGIGLALDPDYLIVQDGDPFESDITVHEVIHAMVDPVVASWLDSASAQWLGDRVAAIRERAVIDGNYEAADRYLQECVVRSLSYYFFEQIEKRPRGDILRKVRQDEAGGLVMVGVFYRRLAEVNPRATAVLKILKQTFEREMHEPESMTD